MVNIFRGTKTSVNIDNVEERKIHDHFNFVTQKLEKLHKNVMWNMYIGRSYLDKVSNQKFAWGGRATTYNLHFWQHGFFSILQHAEFAEPLFKDKI